MKTLIDIDHSLIKKLIKETKSKTKKRKEFLDLVGNYDFDLSLKELEKLRNEN